MGLCNSPAIFQEKINELFAGFNYVRVYIKPPSNIKGVIQEHLKHLNTVLEHLETAGRNINVTKSCFVAHELEYLAYCNITGKYTASTVEAIKNGQAKKQARSL